MLNKPKAIRFVFWERNVIGNKVVKDIYELSVNYKTKDPIGNAMRKLTGYSRSHITKMVEFSVEYVPFEDALVFLDLPLLSKPEDVPNKRYICPVCKGHGHWNLELDAYGKGQHFRAACFQCNGWGWVDEKDKDCVHEFKEIALVGRCLHKMQCSKCGQERTVDSSD